MLYDTFLVIDVLLLTLSIVSIMLLRFDKYLLSAPPKEEYYVITIYI